MPTKVAFDETGELEQVNVLYSFLEDRYHKKVGDGSAKSGSSAEEVMANGVGNHSIHCRTE